MNKKTALITGASRGIGKAIATALAQHGWDLIINCRHSREELTALRDFLQDQYHISCTAYLADAGVYEEVEVLCRNCLPSLPALDLVVNNAGIAYLGLLSDMDIHQWNAVIQTNLTSVFNICKHTVPLMVRQQSGKIINISSVWGQRGASCEVAYSASKGGVDAFTRALAKELAPSNIQVNGISCGFIDTAMNQQLSDSEKQSLFQEIPAGRAGTPAEVAELVLTLAASNAYLTGQIIQLDGGWM